MNRPLFTNDLAQWLDAVPDVRDRLGTGRGARIADIGSGDGWSTIALALAFPEARVDGYDADRASVAAARRHAAQAGVSDRVTFHHRDVAAPGALLRPYDLVLVFEVLHDLSQPEVVLERLRDALADGGVVLVADERVSPQFTAPGSAVERLMYGWSVMHCLPASLAEPGSAGLGTVPRPAQVHALAAAAAMQQRGTAGRERLLPLLPAPGGHRRLAADRSGPGVR